MGRKLAVLVAALSLGLIVSLANPAPPAIALNQQDSTGGHGATLRVAIQKQIDSLNPFLGYSLSATDLFRQIYPTLTTYSPDNFSVMPELAQHWQSSPDRLTWTFAIRPGVKWTDGQPVTAKDAAYTFNRMITEPAAAKANGNFVENFDSVTAPDDQTLVIKTKTPQATMTALDVPIVPEHIWRNVKDVASFANDKMPVVGSGPFELTEYQPEQHATLRANKHFWRGAPKIDELRFVQFKNSDAAVQALRKGDVDVVQKLTPAQFDALKGQDNITQVKGQGRRFFEIVLNPGATNSENAPIGTGHPALRDIRVRQAIDRAIDRKTIVDKVLGGYGQIGGGYVPPIFDDFTWAPEAARARGFDPAAANAMLDQAGYRRGPGGERVGPDGKPLNFRFVLHGDESADAQVGEFVKRWLEDVGIKVELQPVSDNQLDDRTTSGDFDMVISGWSANPDPDYVLRLQSCAARPKPGASGTPDTFLCDKTYDDFSNRQLAEFDPAARAGLVKQAEQRFYDQAAGLIVYYQNSLEAYRSDRFSGFTTQPTKEGVITAQQGYWGYYGAQPTAAAMGAGGSNYGTVALVLGLGVLGLGAVLVLMTMRRRATADDRE